MAFTLKLMLSVQIWIETQLATHSIFLNSHRLWLKVKQNKRLTITVTINCWNIN